MGRKYQVISGDGHLETPPDFVAYLPREVQGPRAEADHAARRRRRRLADGGHAAHVRQPEPAGPRQGEVRGPELLQGRRLPHRRRRRRRAASPRAGRGRHRRRTALRAGVRQPVPREDPRPRRVPGHGRVPTTTGSPTTARSRPTASSATRSMPVSGIDDAVAELERVHAMGFKSVQLLNSPNGGNAPKPEDDRFWEKALELDMPLSPHMSFAWRDEHRRPPPRHRAVAGRSGHDAALADRAGTRRWRSSS